MVDETAAHTREVDKRKIETAVRMILEAIGEDPEREGLVDTPRRVAEAYAELCAGMRENVERHLEVYFQEEHDELVLVRDIPFYSLCEHHLLPFFGKAHIAYIPRDGRVTGLSKLARVVEAYARRLQMQERLTKQIADALMTHLKPQGVAVVLEAEHLCMSMRGVKKPGSKTVTSAMRGIFRKDEKTRAEVLALIFGHGIAV
ncbi:MAG: GTP cyclohydrolase I FolE [Firmicutes bacterium ZCTH02-B6]|nr:MAG: GTP cyclohydrolase I FolE [Firmicutes bacterium ZCTH02-B6]